MPDMIAIPGGTLLMGSDEFYRDEGPVHEREVAPFELDVHPVTNEEYQAFVDETGYVTVAERDMNPSDFPGADPADLVPGSMVFTPTTGPVDLRDWRQWWRWEPGASWREPEGPGSSVADRLRHPVVHVSFEDASAYATWAGRRLPTEAEWEWAARGGLVGARFAWGDEERPQGRLLANSWQGRFPFHNSGAEGWVGSSPVGTFPPNGYGLLDMIGNVWEWTSSCVRTAARRSRDGRRWSPAAARTCSGDARRPTRAACSRAARNCARRTTACATAPRHARRSPTTQR